AHIHDFDLRDGGGNLGEVQRGVGIDHFLLLGGGGLGGGDGGGGLLMLAVLQELHDLDSPAGADDHVPLRQLVLDLALHDGDLAGDDQGTGVDLVGQIKLVEELLHGAAGELAGGPGGQNGHTGGVGNQQVDRHLGA